MLMQPTEGSSPRSNQTGKWISAFGWLLTIGAVIGVLVGFSDLANLTLLAIAGVVFIPIGLLLVTNGRILSKLTNLEKSAHTADEQRPLDKGRFG